MGCFFGCFRVRDDIHPQINIVSQPIIAITKEPVDSLDRNHIWSLLVPEAENSDPSQCKEGRFGVTGSTVLDNDLRTEAKFLKACGTLPQTPAEIRNTEKSKDSLPRDVYTETCDSWLPNTATEMASEKPPDQLHSPIKLLEEWENGSESSLHSPNSCATGNNTYSTCTSSSEGCEVGHVVKDTQAPNSSTSHTPMVPSTQYKNKSVRFQPQNDAGSFSSRSSSPKATDEKLNPSESPYNHFVKPSPYPTPLKLTNDMQTPGTVFPSYVYNNDIGKNPRIRVQYVNMETNLGSFSELEAPIEEVSSPDKSSAPLEERFGQDDKETSQSQASANEMKLSVAVTLSSWLPPNGCNDQCAPDFGLTPGTRPILGMVAAHWNADETSFSPKWWDGNGIPNTTNKYKEDQKVSWHATPFEERLEKALSEDKLSAERKQVGETLPIDF